MECSLASAQAAVQVVDRLMLESQSHSLLVKVGSRELRAKHHPRCPTVFHFHPFIYLLHCLSPHRTFFLSFFLFYCTILLLLPF